MEQLFEEINKIFIEVFKKRNLKLKITDPPLEIDGWDSLNHVILIAAIENHYSIEFSFRDLASIKNVGDLVNIVENKIYSRHNET
jgi:acyl carrier protein